MRLLRPLPNARVPIIINSPNNPVGVVYTRETLEGLAEVLRTKRKEFGSSLFLISDEPYRELAYGPEVSWGSLHYDKHFGVLLLV